MKGLRAINAQKGKIVTAACSTWEDKMAIMRSKKRLSENKDDRKPQVFIDSDLLPEDRKAQSIVRVTAKELRKGGKNVQVQFLKLKVDGEMMFFNRATQVLEKRTFRSKNENSLLERTGSSQEGTRNQ